MPESRGRQASGLVFLAGSVAAKPGETSVFDGIDTSIAGLATLAGLARGRVEVRTRGDRRRGDEGRVGVQRRCTVEAACPHSRRPGAPRSARRGRQLPRALGRSGGKGRGRVPARREGTRRRGRAAARQRHGDRRAQRPGGRGTRRVVHGDGAQLPRPADAGEHRERDAVDARRAGRRRRPRRRDRCLGKPDGALLPRDGRPHRRHDASRCRRPRRPTHAVLAGATAGSAMSSCGATTRRRRCRSPPRSWSPRRRPSSAAWRSRCGSPCSSA